MPFFLIKMLDILPLEMRILRLCSISLSSVRDITDIFHDKTQCLYRWAESPSYPRAVPRGMSYVLRGIINFFVKLNSVGLNFQVLNRSRFVALKLGIIRQFRFINLTNVGTVYFNRFFYGTPFSWGCLFLTFFL